MLLWKPCVMRFKFGRLVAPRSFLTRPSSSTTSSDENNYLHPGGRDAALGFS